MVPRGNRALRTAGGVRMRGPGKIISFGGLTRQEHSCITKGAVKERRRSWRDRRRGSRDAGGRLTTGNELDPPKRKVNLSKPAA